MYEKITHYPQLPDVKNSATNIWSFCLSMKSFLFDVLTSSFLLAGDLTESCVFKFSCVVDFLWEKLPFKFKHFNKNN